MLSEKLRSSPPGIKLFILLDDRKLYFVEMKMLFAFARKKETFSLLLPPLPPTRQKVHPQPHAASLPIPRWRHAKRPVLTIFLLPIQVHPLRSTNKMTKKLGKDGLISDILTLHILSLGILSIVCYEAINVIRNIPNITKRKCCSK